MSIAEKAFALLEARDPYTSGHSMRVRALALQLAQFLRLDRSSEIQLSLAAKLHDIGKVGIPAAILNKPGQLTAAELAIVRRHPVIGERMLHSVVASREVLAAIRGHHERYDGDGYPDGLRGERIPLAARIIALADCFDALTHARAYRPAVSPDSACEVIRAGAGSQFDPGLAPAFLKIVAQSENI